MQDHPQIKAFHEAASMLRSERYWDHGATVDRVEFLQALGEVLTEVCYHLDANEVLPRELLEVGQGLAGPATRRLPVRPSAELLLMTCLDRRIEQLIAAPYVSRNTGEEWSCST
ncbi:hypothetical protein [Arthrobacter sp. UYCo732]|uniref:hypothetical protein n=1 Tax=Arthrobacter sp. UYCo732 TaxID=3156336 RepID=UPI0033965833